MHNLTIFIICKVLVRGGKRKRKKGENVSILHALDFIRSLKSQHRLVVLYNVEEQAIQPDSILACR